MASIALILKPSTAELLLSKFAPKFPVVRCHHVTLKFGVSADEKLPSPPKSIAVVGYATDGTGIEALVVEIDGTTARADGSTYHITHSRLAEVESAKANQVIRDLGWKRLAEPVPIEAELGFDE